jgi:hypothetical protein
MVNIGLRTVSPPSAQTALNYNLSAKGGIGP